jgi:hypothetical protein
MKTFVDILRAAVPQSFIRNTALRIQLNKLTVEGGVSHHSHLGGTLAYMIVGLERAGVHYVLESYPGKGYLLTATPGKEL